MVVAPNINNEQQLHHIAIYNKQEDQTEVNTTAKLLSKTKVLPKMSSKKIDPIASLRRGKTDWKIKVKVIRNWRGVSQTGEQFKCFNVLLIDQQESKIHAFIPVKHADQHDMDLRCGKVCLITNFVVQQYKPEEKFRPVQNDNQLIFSNNTRIKVLDEKKEQFPADSFDFYDHSELAQLANKTHYLLDVVGIIQNPEIIELRHLQNSRGSKQTKFSITDGSSNINVTIWDSMAERLYQQLVEQKETPIIIILTSCRCGTWNGQVDLSNVGATEFYLNHKHHSVADIRKMLATPDFANKFNQTLRKKKTETHNIVDIKKLGNDYIESYVILHGTISMVDNTKPWFFYECTGCLKKIEMENNIFCCLNCNRRLPHPPKRFTTTISAMDQTGQIEIQLEDREVCTLTGKRAEQVFEEQNRSVAFPKILINLLQLEITVKLRIEESNVNKESATYLATDICHGFYFPQEQPEQETQKMEVSAAEPSTSTYHIDGMSELNFQ